MTVGIPAAFLYHRYRVLWETFFRNLGVDFIVSGETDRRIIEEGSAAAVDETCLSTKIYLGHVASLIGRCDLIFVPRIAALMTKEILCTKFEALYDLVRNTFRDRDIRILGCDIDPRPARSEREAFFAIGRNLGVNRRRARSAYRTAKQADNEALEKAANRQESLLMKDGLKILLVGHAYNVHDAYVGRPIIQCLESLGATLLFADVTNRGRAAAQSTAISESLPWIHNRELVGAVALYKDFVDGVVLVSAFPCGPDSLVNEMILRRVKDKPILQLTLDGQEGTAGPETRLESFVDVLSGLRGGSVV
jgi:predicted nucleotide-binding protein (sugar kinase/HSP70/actin superfamily)